MSLTNLSTKRQRIAELARTKRGVALSKLHHVIDLEWMKEAYRLTRKDGAPGIDGVTADAGAIVDAGTLELGLVRDSVLNSMSDILACMLGFLLGGLLLVFAYVMGLVSAALVLGGAS